MSHHDDLTTIDPSALHDVGGGTTAASSSSDQLATALQSIQAAIANLNKSTSGGSLQ